MATPLTLYPVDASADGFFKLQVGGTAPSNATTTTGWTVGTVASGNYARMFYGVERTSGNFTGTAAPGTAVPDATNFDSFRTATPLTGIFAAEAWDVAIGVIAVTGGGEQDGAYRFRLFKGAAADGSDAVEVTAAAQECSAVTNLTTSSAQLSSLTTWNPGTFACNNEYLFFKSAWRITGAGANANRDVLIRVGSAARIITADFTFTSTDSGTLSETVSGISLQPAQGETAVLAESLALSASGTDADAVTHGELVSGIALDGVADAFTMVDTGVVEIGSQELTDADAFTFGEATDLQIVDGGPMQVVSPDGLLIWEKLTAPTPDVVEVVASDTITLTEYATVQRRFVAAPPEWEQPEPLAPQDDAPPTGARAPPAFVAALAAYWLDS